VNKARQAVPDDDKIAAHPSFESDQTGLGSIVSDALFF